MTKTTNMKLSLARKLGFAVITTGIITLTSGLAAPQEVKAWGIGDAFDFVEDVWEIGADATERVGRAVGDKAKGVGRGTITSNNPPRRRARGTPTSGSGDRRVPEARGTSRPTGDRGLPPARGTSSSNSLPTGDRAVPAPRETSSGNSLPTGDRAVPKPRGESASNNSGTALPPPRRRNERIIVTIPQRPTPITEEDVKPPFCNSKFEDCSGNNGGHDHDGHHDHHGKKAKKGKKSKNGGMRDKSVWGNPVGFDKKKGGTKRNERKLRIKRNDTKVQNRRGNKITVKHRARTQMKRSNTRNVQIKCNNVKRMIRVKRSDRRG